MKAGYIAVRQRGSVAVVDVRGRLTHREGSAAFREAIGKLVEVGSSRILLNLADLETLDAEGRQELIAECMHIARAGGQVKLLNVGQRVKAFLHTTGLCEAFETLEDEESAVRSLAAAKVARRFFSRSEYFLG